MVESVIALSLVLLPLFLAIPIIAKYQDIRTHVVQGARYAAWERTVWFGGDAAAMVGSNQWDANAKGDDEIRAEIGKRILSKTIIDAGTGEATPFSDSDKTSASGAITVSEFWQDRHGTAMLQSYDDVANNVDNGLSPGFVNDIINPLMGVVSYLSDFTLDTHAQYTATVSLAVQPVAFHDDATLTYGTGNAMSQQHYDDDFLVSDALSVYKFNETNTILANGWSANGPGSLDEMKKSDGTQNRTSVYKQVRGLTPTSIFKPALGGSAGSTVDTILNIVNDIMSVVLPEISTLDLGRIQVDEVPKDRTGGGS